MNPYPFRETSLACAVMLLVACLLCSLFASLAAALLILWR